MSGPTPDNAAARETIENKSQLIGYFAPGEKPKDQWRIGTEHEKFAFLTDTLAPVPYDGPRSIRKLLEGLRDRFGWDGVYEGDNIMHWLTPRAWPMFHWNQADSLNFQVHRLKPCTKRAPK